MKKIPGTLYQIEITKAQDDQCNLKMWYRNQLVFEKTKIIEEEIKNSIQNVLVNNGLSVPRNRIEWIVKEELKNSSPGTDMTFAESTVSEMIGEFQKKPPKEMKKIVLMGLSNAGKTCIYERVFERKKPWELMHSAATKGISYKKYKVGSMLKPMIWDLGGQQRYLDEYHGPLKKEIFERVSIFLYIVDVSDPNRFESSRLEFEWAANQLISVSPKAKLYIFLHKIDIIHDKDIVIQHLRRLFSQNISYEIKFYATSIFDESLFRAWSEIVRELSPKSTYINSILKILKSRKQVKDALLIEKSTGLACGSTLAVGEDDEDIIIGMASLLIVTVDRVAREMKLKNLIEFYFKAEDGSVLLSDVSPELMLVVILVKSSLSNGELKELQDLFEEISEQIRQLWSE